MKRKLLTILTLLFLLPVLSVSAHAQEEIPEVATLAELQAAIEAAEDGDTIRVTETIIIDEPMTVQLTIVCHSAHRARSCVNMFDIGQQCAI